MTPRPTAIRAWAQPARAESRRVLLEQVGVARLATGEPLIGCPPPSAMAVYNVIIFIIGHVPMEMGT
jgi:hypothetical protein